ncbi:MAG: peptide-methionine (R)-S-oxide reductase MsrB [Bacteroidota bacterium]
MLAYTQQKSETAKAEVKKAKHSQGIYAVQKTEAEWKAQLSPDAYYVLRKGGTERPFTGEYWDYEEKGTYTCAGCGQALFSSDAKYKSGTGWPSYWRPIRKNALARASDRRTRVEVHCSRCGGHLGHVFNDGPAPIGLRYCINSVSLDFIKEEKIK